MACWEKSLPLPLRERVGVRGSSPYRTETSRRETPLPSPHPQWEGEYAIPQHPP